MALMILGELALDGFEVPASIKFGGAQSAVIHKLIGGGRIIDTMGRDDCALRWRGILSGAGASDRARTLDAMRVAGAVVPLSWDAFCYSVVIADLELEFCNPWWILYRIECSVLSDLAQPAASFALDVTGSVLGDLAAAAGYVDVGSILTALSAPAALLPGASGIAPALIELSSIQTTITSGIAMAEQGLESANVATLVSASGSLAQLANAQGYVDRSVTNLEGVVV